MSDMPDHLPSFNTSNANTNVIRDSSSKKLPQVLVLSNEIPKMNTL